MIPPNLIISTCFRHALKHYGKNKGVSVQSGMGTSFFCDPLSGTFQDNYFLAAVFCRIKIQKKRDKNACPVVIYMSTRKGGIGLDIARIYNDNKNSVYRLALTYLHTQAEAEDVCHDVFMKMMERQDYVFPGKERAWLLTVTANECRNRLKLWKRQEKKIFPDGMPQKDTPSQDILETVLSLSVKERTVIYLYYYEGYTTKEIAGILKITSSAVRSRMERARKHLKTRLEGEGS